MEEALYRAVYSSDPDDETPQSFHARIQCIPAKVREAWGYGAESMVGDAIRAERMELLASLVDGATPAGD